MKSAGIQMRHLPTNGGGPALTAILGNNAQVLVTSVAAVNAQIKAGKLRALACFSGEARGLPARRADDEKRAAYDGCFSLGSACSLPRPAGRNRRQAARGEQEARPRPTVQEGDRQPRRCRCLSRQPARVRQILGRGCQARRGPRSRPSARCEDDGSPGRRAFRSAYDPPQRSCRRRRVHRCRRARSRHGGDLPFGTLASPGAGMLPKLVLGLMMAVRRDHCGACRRKPAARRDRLERLPPRPRLWSRCRLSPSRSTPRSDSCQRDAAAVRAVVFYRAPPPLARARRRIGVTVGSYLLFSTLLKSPLPPLPFWY